MKDDRARTAHPVLMDMRDKWRAGAVTRREFLRVASMLGVGAAATASGLARPAQAETPKAGGHLRVSMRVMESSDPALYDWSEKANMARHVIEPLVLIGRNGTAEPHLAERWEASEDLKTWTFHLRKGVTWSNGDAFGADDVIHNFNRWLDPATGSSNLSRFSALTVKVDTGKKNEKGEPIMTTRARSDALEKVDEHTVRFHLDRPDIALPESMGDYPALIVHRDFDEDGADFVKMPIGTGPYRLAEHVIGEKAVLVKRDAPYWGGDVFLDRITYIDHGGYSSAAIAALASGQVDTMMRTSIEQLDTVEVLPDIVLHEAVTAQTGVARMRVTEKPFDDVNVRRAVQACIDSNRMLDIVYRGRGAPGEDHHVAPIHPEYAPLPIQQQDYDLARRYLDAAGHGNGIEVTIDCVSEPVWEQNTCKAIAEMCKPAGITVNINVMPGGTYWDRWMTTPFGFTGWAHRPLGVQNLNVGYRCGAVWNESGFCNPAFDRLLDEASTLVDPNDRRKVMVKVQKILQEEAVISQDFWRSIFVPAHKRVRNLFAHVAIENHYNQVWLDR